MIALLRIAFRNVTSHWRQSLAAVISITFSFIALVLFQGYMQDALGQIVNEYSSRSMFADVLVEKEGLFSPAGRHEPWLYLLNEKEQKYLDEYLSQKSELDLSMKFLRISGLAASDRASTLFWGLGIEENKGRQMRGDSWQWNTMYGKPLEYVDRADVTLIGQGLGRRLGCLPKEKNKVIHTKNGYSQIERPIVCQNPSIQLSGMTEKGQVNAIDLEVVGIIDGGFQDLDDRYVMTNLKNAQTLMNTKSITYVSLRLKDRKEIDKFIIDLRNDSQLNGFKFHVTEWQKHNDIGDMYKRTTGLLTLFRNFVVTIILVISSLSVLNTMIKTIKERTREIGTLRSIGYKNRQIHLIFIFEAVYLAIIGSFIGTVISLAISMALNSMQIIYRAGVFVEPVPFEIGISKELYLGSVVLLCFLNVGSVLFVCRRVVKKQICENLIYA